MKGGFLDKEALKDGKDVTDDEVISEHDEDIDFESVIDSSAHLMNRETDGDSDDTKRKKFLFRLVGSLHQAGNPSYKTEQYVIQVAKSFGLCCQCSVFPVHVMLSFHHPEILSPQTSESYTLSIRTGWHFYRLSLLDKLVFQIIKARMPFNSACEKLNNIEKETPPHGWKTILAANGAVGFAATTLFFGGTFTDGFWGFVYGVIICLCGFLCETQPGLAEVECFVSSFLVSVIASLLDRFVYNHHLCLFGQLFGGVVWLLPGITITIAILEIFSRMIVYGSSRLVYGIGLALQLGFGLTCGYKLVFGDTYVVESFENGCNDPVSPWYAWILLPLASGSMSVIINARTPTQFVGMILTSGFGFVCNYLLTVKHATIGTQAIPFLSAIVVTAVGRLYAHFQNERPYVYICSGLLVLVPGGVGVRGMSQMWSGNTGEGLEFTFRMLMIGISLAIGVFTALIPRKSWFRCRRSNSSSRSNSKRALAINEEEDSMKEKLIGRASASSTSGLSMTEA